MTTGHLEKLNVLFWKEAGIARLRAIDDTEKLSKRRSILDAAARIYLEQGGELPSVSDIAAASGLAKGTIYLYFRTREEIFLALLEDAFGSLMDGLEAMLAVRMESSDPFPAVLISGYVGLLKARPSFLRLASLTNTVLEHNIDPATVVSFKRVLVVRLHKLGREVDVALGMPEGTGAKLLLQMHAVTIGLWQVLDCPQKFRPMLGEEIFQVLLADFYTELPVLLSHLIQGRLASVVNAPPN